MERTHVFFYQYNIGRQSINSMGIGQSRQRLTQINPGLGTLKGIIFCFQPGNLKYEKHAAEKRSNIVQCNIDQQEPRGKKSRKSEI